MERLPEDWDQIRELPPKGFECGHCGHFMSSHVGYATQYPGNPSYVGSHAIYICAHCLRPTFFQDRESNFVQVPGPSFGQAVERVPPSIEELYNEARICMTVSAFTSAVLACRKLLMNIAVEEGAKPGETFIAYIEYLAEQGYVPPGGKGWVDHIRKQGNEATHEIDMKSQSDAEDLISFVEMLLKFIYEFPGRVPQAEPAEEAAP